MRLTRIRLAGFKTFLDAADVPIEPGLTGIVGPNGCGKSNLVEALRWAMGESSHRSLRAAEMDDVIFAGSGKRPGRNAAEVALKIDNTERDAPAAFNGGDEIEVVRRITRGVGSSYRINGREVRARDVQTLFADASTGARSPALIGQGRVGEIIHAKPEGRRRLLEEAAGITGLNARRQEAELRLKAADANLERVEDVLGQLDARIEGLKRQARAANRYRQLSGELRRLEAVRLVTAWREARGQAGEAESAAALAIAAVAEATRAQGEAARAEGLAEHALPPARTSAQEAGNAHARLLAEAERLRAAEREARSRQAALEQQARTAAQDLVRERQLGEDAAEALERLVAEAEELTRTAVADEQRPLLEARLQEARTELAAAEAELAAAVAAEAERNARRNAAARRRDDAAARVARFRAEAERLTRDSGARIVTAAATPGDLAEELGRLVAATAEAEAGLQAAMEAHAAARTAEAAARGPLSEADGRAVRLAAEAGALRKLVQRPADRGGERLIDRVEVDEGFEKALGAALGEDLEASLEATAPLHWVGTVPVEDSALPEGIACLADVVRAPEALLRRLRQIGIVDRADGPGRRAELCQGQRLVSREGDLWRWDGFTRTAEAETQAARRLVERNRLDTLQRRAGEAETAAAALRKVLEGRTAEVRAAASSEHAAQAAARDARKRVDAARERLTAAERAEAAENARRAAQVEAERRIRASLSEAENDLSAAEQEIATLAAAAAAAAGTAEPQRRATAARTEAAEAGAALEALRREDAERARREAALRTDIDAWTRRRKGAETRIQELGERSAEIERAIEAGRDAPERIAAEAAALERRREEAERAAKAAADRLALAETAKAEASRVARAALEALAGSREAQVRADERFIAAKARLAEWVERIVDEHGMPPDALAAKIDVSKLDVAEVESELARLTRDRDRLGPVNLRAESELAEVEGSRGTLVAERDDIVAAIRQLRRAIHTLNDEGRARLLASFEVVDRNFRQLFSTLFEGGEARLELIQAEDPLASGLEVHAKPPGKRPHTLSLLSGGEQALTALSLVFAVFLTNPAPICVLDEVDAPLDDANVERFCTLLEAMTRTTDTRFLVVTHNPITMSRMNRLLGVTMAEQGVSQLVSVALEEAERLREAG